MAKFKASTPKPKLVWRISKRAPNGEWVDPTTTAADETPVMHELPEVTSGGWVMSSFDLLNGTDINEDENTIPGELFDELFAPPTKPPEPPKK